VTKRIIAAFLILAILLILPSCNKKDSGGNQGNSNSSSATVSTADTAGMNFDFTDRDSEGEYDPTTSVQITLADSACKVNGVGATAKDSNVSITAEGTYILSGSISDGSITVDADDTAKIRLVLNGVDITNKSGAALYIKGADKVFVTLADGTENSLADGDSYAQTDGDTTVDAALFSRADLTLNGSGSLTVKGNYKHGVVSKDDLVITAGELTVTSKNVGLNGKDCVKISNADIAINAGSDGIRSDNEEDADRGYIYIESGKLNITAQNDGIQAQTVANFFLAFELLTFLLDMLFYLLVHEAI